MRSNSVTRQVIFIGTKVVENAKIEKMWYFRSFSNTVRPVLMDTNVLFMYPFSFRLDTIFEKPVAKKPHLDTLHAVKNYSMSCGTGLNGYNWTKLSIPVFLVSQCLKITKKVAFNIASEASYVYILSGQKFI